jgi:hypothetical protein
MLGAKRLDGTDQFYMPCDKVQDTEIVDFSLQDNQSKLFRLYARHLVTPVSRFGL